MRRRTVIVTGTFSHAIQLANEPLRLAELGRDGSRKSISHAEPLRAWATRNGKARRLGNCKRYLNAGYASNPRIIGIFMPVSYVLWRGDFMLELAREEVRRLFSYQDGFLVWRVTNSARNVAGNIAGSKGGEGYWSIGIGGHKYRAHRLIWVFFNGAIPEGKQIDHADGNRLNNRIENLRIASHAENVRHRKHQKNNTSGERGVFFNKPLSKWTVQIRKNGKLHHFGCFSDYDEAVSVARAKRLELHGEFSGYEAKPS